MTTLSWDRRMVPQWSLSSDPEIYIPIVNVRAPSETRSPSEIEPDLARALEDFRLFPSVGTAADLMRFGPRLGGSNAQLKDAAAYLVKQNRLPEALTRLAQDVIQGTRSPLWILPAASVADGIHSIRHSLRKFPHDPLTWLDLGRLHAANGNLDSAQRAVIVALSYGRRNRLILRGASRFFLHAKDPERALAILNRNPRTAGDPWLMAGHIAISSILDRTSRYISKGRRIIHSHDMSPWETAELAMSLGTVELENGATRQARKWFNIGLEAPNRNVLAQGAWAAGELKIALNVPSNWLDGSCSSEAAYYQALAEIDFKRALGHSVQWYRSEPFASRSMVAASFLASILGQVDDAVEFARQGLISEPNNAQLQNNLVFALALAGHVQQAEQALIKVAKRERAGLSPHTIANMGMLAFLSGETSLAEQLYERAITRYQQDKRPQEAAIAGACRALAARLTGAEYQEFWKQEASRLSRAAGSSFVERIREILLREAHPALAVPRKYDTIAKHWHYDKQNNTLIVESRKPFGRT